MPEITLPCLRSGLWGQSVSTVSVFFYLEGQRFLRFHAVNTTASPALGNPRISEFWNTREDTFHQGQEPVADLKMVCALLPWQGASPALWFIANFPFIFLNWPVIFTKLKTSPFTWDRRLVIIFPSN